MAAHNYIQLVGISSEVQTGQAQLQSLHFTASLLAGRGAHVGLG